MKFACCDVRRQGTLTSKALGTDAQRELALRDFLHLVFILTHEL